MRSTITNHVRINGIWGVGKTTVLLELRERGFACIDMDKPGGSFMHGDGHQHRNVQRLGAVLAKAEQEQHFVFGCAEE